MTSSRELLELLGDHHWTGMKTGRVRSMQVRLQRRGTGAIEARRQLLEQLAGRETKQKRPQHIHPESTATRIRREAEDLTPAELVWLQRLPIDPTQITHEQAERLAAIYSSLSQMKAESSKQLVASIWLPVKAIHDRLVADDRLARARQPLPPTPGVADAALREALATEHPDWPDAAVAATAADLLDKASERRQAAHQRELAGAEAAAQEIKDAAASRDEITRRTA